MGLAETESEAAIRILVDGSAVEVFSNDGKTLTQRVRHATVQDIVDGGNGENSWGGMELVVLGGRCRVKHADVWSMGTIWPMAGWGGQSDTV